MKPLPQKHWHHLSQEEVLDLLDTNPDKGLDRFEMEDRQRDFGPNALTERKGQGPLLRFLLQFNQALVYILLAAVIIKLLLGAFGLFEWALASGASDAEARTVTVNAFVMVELFYLFNCRSLTKSMFQVGLLSNPWIVVGATSMIVLQLFYTYAPPMNRLFHSAPISLMDWVHIVAVSFLIYLVVGVEKTRRRRKTGSEI